ncbi:MAG: winged helix-turn-helix transcriptional regulator [Clostridia bacterium]|nr:winged helix-turn-helix transcriptional regulator [Clostridia bacterium]
MQNATSLCLDDKTMSMISDYVPSGDILDEIVGFFSVFADQTRIKILSALSISETCVSDLASALSINQTTVSHQLRTMKDVGAVGCRRVGKIIYYYIKDDIVSEILLKGMEFLGQ